MKTLISRTVLFVYQLGHAHIYYLSTLVLPEFCSSDFNRNTLRCSGNRHRCFFSLLPEVASRQVLQARRHSAVQGGLAALPRSLHEEQGWELQQQPEQGEPTLHVATQLGPDHAWVKRERRHARACRKGEDRVRRRVYRYFQQSITSQR